MNLIQLKKADIKLIRERWVNEQNNICPILKKTYPLNEFTLDHLHKLKNEVPDETGKGCIRGAIQFQANALEGKITNSFKRMGLEKHIDLVSFLRNLANYLDCNRQHTEDDLLIHPNEAPPKKVLMKRSYNKLIKIINNQQKVPEYKHKRGNYTKALEKLYIKYALEPEFKQL